VTDRQQAQPDSGPERQSSLPNNEVTEQDSERQVTLAHRQRMPRHRFLTNDYGSVPDTLDGRTSFATCWDMVWIKDESMGQEITVWWQQAPKVALYLMAGYFRCLWLQGVRRRRSV
jgi:hypothetical protein